jgi:hypothetical protein
LAKNRSKLAKIAENCDPNMDPKYAALCKTFLDVNEATFAAMYDATYFGGL